MVITRAGIEVERPNIIKMIRRLIREAIDQ